MGLAYVFREKSLHPALITIPKFSWINKSASLPKEDGLQKLSTQRLYLASEVTNGAK